MRKADELAKGGIGQGRSRSGLIATKPTAGRVAAWRAVRLVAACGVGLSAWALAERVVAQEATSAISVPQALMDMERVVTEVIGRCEKSVVSVLRVRSGAPAASALEPRFDPFNRPIMPGERPQSLAGADLVPNSFGTGVVIDAKGLILTNYHVVSDEGSQYFVTTGDRKPYEARIKAADPRSDLAVLEIQATDLTPITFGDASTVRKGQFVIALGNPYSIARDGQVSASWGIVANVGRKVATNSEDPEQRFKLHHLGGLIQTDARLNLGTSGGALVNLKGEMVGLTTSLAAMAGYEQSAGYALPVDQVFRRIVEVLKEGREVEYGFLGVWPMDLDLAERMEGRHGARVNQVVPGTPAYQANLKEGDIITAVNGEPIFDKDGLFLNIGNMPVEAVVRLTVERTGQVVPVTVELAKSNVRGRKVVTQVEPSWRGLRVDFPTALPSFQDRFREDPYLTQGGVAVSEVEAGSPAEGQELRPGMLITHVDGARVHTPRQFREAVANKPGPVVLRLGVKPDDRPERTIDAEPASG